MSYSTSVGAFLERDPIGYDDGMNVYEFVHDNPVNHVDPTGLTTDKYGTDWDPSIDWSKDPSRKPDGFIPGMGYPPGNAHYNTRPDLEKMANATCRRVVRGCFDCQQTFDKRKAALLKEFGLGPIGSGLAGAGKGIITGAVIKGVTTGIGVITESSSIGPIGTIGGAAVGLAGTASGFIDGNSKYYLYKQRADSIQKAYDECMQSCDPKK